MPKMGEVSYTLSKRDKEIQSKVESLVGTIESKELSAIFARVQLGILLVEIKKEKGKDFYNVIVESMFSKKKTQRTMKMVLKSDVDFVEAMKTSGSDTDVTERVKLLELDKRFLKFQKESDMSKIYDLSLTKIESMKSLTQIQWDKVVSGKDNPYLDMIKKQSEKSKKASEKAIASHKPKSMKKADFDKAVKAGIFPAITTMYEFSLVNTKLEKNVKSLESELLELKEQKHKLEVELARFDGMIAVSGNLKSQDIKTQQKVKNT